MTIFQGGLYIAALKYLESHSLLFKNDRPSACGSDRNRCDEENRGKQNHGKNTSHKIHNLPENKLDEIAITLSLKDYDSLERIVGLCEKSGVHTKFIPDYNSVIPSKPYTEDLNGLPVINIRHVPLSNTLNSMAKRVVPLKTLKNWGSSSMLVLLRNLPTSVTLGSSLTVQLFFSLDGF